MNPFPEIQTPYYIVYEDRIRRNLSLIRRTAEEAGVKFIMALKANALWKTFPIVAEYIPASTASSLNEMKLSRKYLGKEVHAYCPAYTEVTFPQYLDGCTHITFNTLSQYEMFADSLRHYNEKHPEKPVSAGLRINPQCSVIETDIYNPCTPGSRFGMEKDMMPEELPEGIEGLHFHALCESSSYDLEKVLKAVEEQFGKHLDKVRWINMGGGHLLTREGYDVAHLVRILKEFRLRHPNLDVILEPGSAFMWRTGDLISSVVDVVDKGAVKTAVMDVSFACHMPDCLEMPYKPVVSEALPDDSPEGIPYRLGGNSCLSGDYTGDWKFATPLSPGDVLTLEDMNHYTTVKTNMFNGIDHPAIYFKPIDSDPVCLRKFTFEDYEARMD